MGWAENIDICLCVGRNIAKEEFLKIYSIIAFYVQDLATYRCNETLNKSIEEEIGRSIMIPNNKKNNKIILNKPFKKKKYWIHFCRFVLIAYP